MCQSNSKNGWRCLINRYSWRWHIHLWNTVQFYFIAAFGFTPFDLALYIANYGLLEMVGNGILVRLLVRCIRVRTLLIIGYAQAINLHVCLRRQSHFLGGATLVYLMLIGCTRTHAQVRGPYHIHVHCRRRIRVVDDVRSAALLCLQFNHKFFADGLCVQHGRRGAGIRYCTAFIGRYSVAMKYKDAVSTTVYVVFVFAQHIICRKCRFAIDCVPIISHQRSPDDDSTRRVRSSG